MSRTMTVTELKNRLKPLSHYVECGTDFTNEYGDIDDPFYNSLGNMFRKVVKNINKAETGDLFWHFETWLEKLCGNVNDIGWGYGDEMLELYGQITWRE